MNKATLRIFATIVIAVALISGGCSCKKSKKTAAPGKPAVVSKETKTKTGASKTPVAPVIPPQPLVAAPAATLGTVTGTISLSSAGKNSGNLYVFILDEKMLPSVSLLGASVYPAETIGSKKMSFIIKNVPPGRHRAIAVWDTAPPHCQMTNLYCAASVKDGIGQSAPIDMPKSGSASGIIIKVE